MADRPDPNVVEPYGSAPKPDVAKGKEDPAEKPNDPKGKNLTQPSDTKGG
jgi:hypothetical protein